MKKWHWAVLVILAYLLFLIAYTPATYVTALIQEQSKNQISFQNVSGTLFEGQASSVSSQGIVVNNLNWQLSPWSLILLQAKLELNGGNIRNAQDIYLKGRMTASLLNTQRFSVEKAQVFVPTKTLLSQLKLPVFVTASGRFRVDINTFSFDQGCQELEGNGNWLNAGVNVNNKQVDFGTFDASLSCQGEAFALQIAPSNGLNLDAKAVAELGGKFSVQGEFNIPDSMPNEIKQAAPYFGRETSSGRYTINF